MDYKLKKNDDATVDITVKHNRQEVEAAYRKAYEKARAKVKLPGFRPGKAPVDLIEKHLGESVAEDAARILLVDTLRDLVNDLDPAPIDVPEFAVEEFDRSKGATYKGKYDTAPVVKLGKYRKIKIQKRTLQIPEEIIAEELGKLQRKHGALRLKEEGTVARDDFVTVNLKISDEGEILFERPEYQFQAGTLEVNIPDLSRETMGKSAQATFAYTADFPNTFPDESLAGRTLLVEGTIVRVEELDLPELNDDFARDVGDFENLAALREKIQGEMREHGENLLRQELEEGLITSIVADSRIVVPGTMIRSAVERRLESIAQRTGRKLSLTELAELIDRDAKELEAEMRKEAERTVARQIAILEIIKKEKIAVSEDDIDGELKEAFAGYLAGDQLEKLLTDEKLRDDARGRRLFKKCMDWLIENANLIQEKTVTFKELIKEQEQT
ncbi:MAG: trigger factor [Spirochaetales bacterium]|nr:trigger factor [Spirochaetales bacterium]